ncbi:MAG: hypothetical protein ACFE9C_13625 [Candidatus Hodarchaeota archaeon]
MLSSTICDKCGYLMNYNVKHQESCLDCTQFYCSKCGYRYEVGFRYNSLIEKHVKYIRFIQ